MTLIDLFREFSQTAMKSAYTVSSRVLYYTLLSIWNSQRRPKIANLPYQTLITLTGLKVSTFKDAFQYLADRGWVKRVKSRNRLEFSWIMTDNRLEAVPTSGFVVHAPAEKQSEVRVEESLNSDSSCPTKTENRGNCDDPSRLPIISKADSVNDRINNVDVPAMSGTVPSSTSEGAFNPIDVLGMFKQLSEE